MKALLAIVIAGSTSVVASLLVRSRRPNSHVAVEWLLIVAALAAMGAEGATVLWVGPPKMVFEPLFGGLLVGTVAAWFSARKPPKSRDKAQPPDH